MASTPMPPSASQGPTGPNVPNLPVRRLRASDGVNVEKWSDYQVALASINFDVMEPFSSGVSVHVLEKLPDWVRCAYVNTMADPEHGLYACGSYPHFLVAVTWVHEKYGNWLYPSCRQHLPFLVENAQIAVDLVNDEDEGKGAG